MNGEDCSPESSVSLPPDWRELATPTTPEQFERLRNLTGEQRFRIMSVLSHEARVREMTRILAEHPDWEPWQVNVEFMRWVFKDEPLPRGFEEHAREHWNWLPRWAQRLSDARLHAASVPPPALDRT